VIEQLAGVVAQEAPPPSARNVEILPEAVTRDDDRNGPSLTVITMVRLGNHRDKYDPDYRIVIF